MVRVIISWFDQFPKYNDQKIEIRGRDGYVSVRDISKAIGKRFSNWTRTKFAKDVLVNTLRSKDTEILLTELD